MRVHKRTRSFMEMNMALQRCELLAVATASSHISSGTNKDTRPPGLWCQNSAQGALILALLAL